MASFGTVEPHHRHARPGAGAGALGRPRRRGPQLLLRARRLDQAAPLRAALSDLTGGDTQGGSGITQQYVKNAYLNDSRTLSRKLKELVIAVKLTPRVLARTRSSSST